MAAAARGPFESISKWGAGTGEDKADGGIGLGAEKNPTPTLRIFGSNLGNQWVTYGTTGGGTQDYVPSNEGSNTPAQCTWFRFYYTGLMEIGPDAIFGNWKITVEGKYLDKVAYEVGKHVKPTLFVGEQEAGKHTITVKSIKVEPYKPKKLKIVDGQITGEDDDEEDYERRGC
jgi:hypothetical protein